MRQQVRQRGRGVYSITLNRTKNLGIRHMKKTCLVLIALLAMPVFVDVASAAKYKDRAPRYSFAFSAESLGDGSGNTIDIHGGGKITLMGWSSPGPSDNAGWWYNVWIDGHGSMTFVTDGNKESIKWKLGPTALFYQLSGTLIFALKISGKLPNWVTEPITVTLIIGSEATTGTRTTGTIIVNIGETSTYSGTGLIEIHPIS